MSKVDVQGNRSDVTAAVEEIKGLIGDPYGSSNNQYTPKVEPPPEPMEYEQIDWQAAARESVSKNASTHYTLTEKWIMKPIKRHQSGWSQQSTLGQIAAVAKEFLWRTSGDRANVGRARGWNTRTKQPHNRWQDVEKQWRYVRWADSKSNRRIWAMLFQLPRYAQRNQKARLSKAIANSSASLASTSQR